MRIHRTGPAERLWSPRTAGSRGDTSTHVRVHRCVAGMAVTGEGAVERTGVLPLVLFLGLGFTAGMRYGITMSGCVRGYMHTRVCVFPVCLGCRCICTGMV